MVLQIKPRQVRAIQCFENNREDIQNLIGKEWNVIKYMEKDNSKSYYELSYLGDWTFLQSASPVVFTVEIGDFIIKDNGRLDVFSDKEIFNFFEMGSSNVSGFEGY